jgi:tRNA C32,U32 (ribose-2'-O)-methylase TrmJ
LTTPPPDSDIGALVEHIHLLARHRSAALAAVAVVAPVEPEALAGALEQALGRAGYPGIEVRAVRGPSTAVLSVEYRR